MDLNKYLKEPAQLNSDLGWWIDAETFDVEGNHRNPHECKDELALQWGNDGFLIKTDDNIVPVSKENKKAAIQSDIIQITRGLMNSGMKTADIRKYLAKHQNPNVISSCSQEIDRQLRLGGSVGRFVLDARGYKNCSEALKTAEKNPFKKYIKYMIGCSCSNHIKTKKFTSGMMVSDGDPIGDALNDKTQTEVNMSDACPKTGMQILSGQGDLDEKWSGDTMIDIMGTCKLDKDGVKKITASGDTPYIRLKRFFIALDNGEFSAEQKEPLDMSANQETCVGIDPDAMCFDLNKDAEKDPVGKMSVGSDLLVDRLEKDAEKPIEFVSITPELKVDKPDDDVETIPFDIPIPETNTFSLNNTENKDIPVNCSQAPVEVDVIPPDVIGDIEFGTPEEDELYCDGMITLDNNTEKDGMSFSF